MMGNKVTENVDWTNSVINQIHFKNIKIINNKVEVTCVLILNPKRNKLNDNNLNI